MLTHLKLKDFRAFHQQNFNFSKLNIFVGRNNSGKSSALSAINLIAQTL
ncbi:MAG: AAA family ATPase, partial [Sphingomonadales bacterium]